MKKKNSINSSQDKPIARRGFLTRLWQGLGVFAALEFTGLSLAFLFSGRRKHTSGKAHYIECGAVNDFKANSAIPFRSGLFYLCRLDDGGFLALSLHCTHLGCSVAWRSERNQFLCPCHASAFDLQGNVINPPATRALDLFPVIIEGKTVKVDISRKIRRKRFKKSQVTYV